MDTQVGLVWARRAGLMVSHSGLEVGGATELLERRLHQLGVFSVISSEQGG